jgi:dTDP-4-dehydrorhamnose 3,5-epimerase
MIVEKTRLDGVLAIRPRRFGDDRGFFSETYNRRNLVPHGLDLEFVQDNHSRSVNPGTVRGLHFQAPPHGQGKLIRCVRGALLDVAVDIRAGSPTYGQWTGLELSAENGWQLFVPEGFAHGFMTLKADTEVVYKCTDYYAPDAEGSLRWDDPDIAIEWPLQTAPTLSEKDAAAPPLAGFVSPFKFKG